MTDQIRLCRRKDVETHTAFEALSARGAHFVLVRPNKRPLSEGWQETGSDLSDVERHAEGGGLVGVIPASLGCFVVDIDEGGENGV